MSAMMRASASTLPSFEYTPMLLALESDVLFFDLPPRLALARPSSSRVRRYAGFNIGRNFRHGVAT